MRWLYALGTLAWLGLCLPSAHGETYPTRPITIVVAYPAGGATDVIARAVSRLLSEDLGQPIIIENKGGANTQIGATYVARSTPDGYTLLVTADTTFDANPFLYRKLSYDAVKDFVAVSGLGAIHQALVVHPSVAMDSVGDLIAAAKARPGELNYATYGIGSPGHLSMELLQSLAGVKLNAVHYKGAGPAFADVIAGHVPMVFLNVGLMAPVWRAGQVKPLGVTSNERLAAFPDLPAIAERMPGFRASYWFGLFAPHGTPAEIVTRLNAGVQRALANADFKEKFLVPNFYEPIIGSPEKFADLIKVDVERWRKIIVDAHISMDD